MPLRRLNRREYAYAIRDLLGLDIDARAWLPDDNVKGNFDNNAAALQVSPNFIDQYIYAARAVALEAIGNPKAPAETITYGDVANMVISLPPTGAPGTGRQQHHLEGMPFGTRGGFSRRTQLPGGRRIRAHHRRHGAGARSAADGIREHGDRAARWQGVLSHHHRRRRRPQGDRSEARSRGRGDQRSAAEDPVHATAGQHKLAITFLQRSFAESDERMRTIALEGGQERIQAAHALQIRGPLAVTGLSAVRQPREDLRLPAREATQRERNGCASKIVENLARRAFRRPVTAEDVNPLMAFYKAGSVTGGFDGGVRDALSAILASPHFLYRAESGAGTSATRTLTDLELASRLSFFLWSSLPDDELLKTAAESRLSKPDVLAAQVSRMLADPRAESLSDDFAFQWLHLSKLDEITPDRGQFPHASGLLDPRGCSRKNCGCSSTACSAAIASVFDLLTADYTFLNERLAMLYGIETVKGSHFRRVTLDNPARRGLLGKGAILMMTAYPNRTSPVLRGAWILDRLLGTPPSDPPLNVPSLPENKRGQPAKTLRARLEQHRENPTCFACHGVMDPLGFALENFNAVGHTASTTPTRRRHRGRRSVAGRHGDQRTGRSAEGAGRSARSSVRAGAHREPADLRAGPKPRLSRHAHCPPHRARRGGRPYPFKSIVLGVVSSDAFRKQEAGGPDQAPGKTQPETQTGGV